MMKDDTLPYEINRYGGALLDSSQISGTAESFSQLLERSLQKIQSEGLQLAWLFLPIQQAYLVPTAVSQGFIYHHADETGIELVLKLQQTAPIPGFATHYIGAGGVVLNEKQELLVIQERYHTRKHFKLPGGALNPGEHIADGVKREVLEETGIHTEFISLNCFRHWHGYRYGKSDIYFICRLKPLSSKIVLDPAEISHAAWMPADTFLQHPDTHAFNRKAVSAALAGEGLKIEEIPGFYSSETHELFF
ncbi:MAG: NUDIX domain-containing protein, partial [Spirochaetia bacterium]|nr:NUDIX domain-containing protein [Spirochaetia bacterium]MCF7953129.1 NUDIX domain-containing protein [Spirochaetales bacterium]